MNKITTDDLRKMSDTEGLIIQGCGGDSQEWTDGLNNMLTEAEILKDGTKFKNVSVFEHDEMTNLLFKFTDDVKLDMGKLAMWRLQSHDTFGGTWVSDYVENKLGGFINETAEREVREKPDCPLIGADSNVFNLMGIASRTLKENGMAAEAKEMREKITSSGSYDKALCIIGEYVNITSVDDECEDCDEEMGGMTLE